MTETQRRVNDVENMPDMLKLNGVRQCALTKKIKKTIRVRQCKLTLTGFGMKCA